MQGDALDQGLTAVLGSVGPEMLQQLVGLDQLARLAAGLPQGVPGLKSHLNAATAGLLGVDRPSFIQGQVAETRALHDGQQR